MSDTMTDDNERAFLMRVRKEVIAIRVELCDARNQLSSLLSKAHQEIQRLQDRSMRHACAADAAETERDAIRALTIEDCAKVCEEIFACDCTVNEDCPHRGADECAAAIRAINARVEKCAG
jgi:hypothetical protein